MLLGYARVSMHDQNLDLQKDALKLAGCEKIYVDTMTGEAKNRPGLEQAFEMLREGDTLAVWRLDRLGRSLKHLIELVQELSQRKVGFKCRVSGKQLIIDSPLVIGLKLGCQDAGRPVSLEALEP